MSKEAPASRLTSKDSQLERSENEFEALSNPLQFSRLRTPLNSITDPSQIQESEVVKSNRISERKVIEAFDKTTNVASTHSTTRVSARHGKVHSEPSSAQCTPARSGSRLSLGGRGMCSSSLSKVSRGASVLKSDYSVEVPQFELVEDPLFWEDHNVQVLIRIRPFSNMERVSQGYARCLRQESSQTLVWLGHPETRFTFDHIASETISQDELFNVAGLPMVENCISGYNSCMFAYGQTGSGKTYTMMGEINEMDGELNEHCGITPRMFEYLFSRIRKEEESRRDERLKFTCKCSFLEIYNEQITDLLEPSSTNLQLREDIKKGVYVENLTEYKVTSVNDIVQLLLQGAANRKIAATYMNSESSRSHSVFTCIIESCWEKDSMTHFRFGRLNLVDLAGSERQKCSGAEGDRLKEAANINKSLSTLGMVIMSLVDLAHGKHRHVPYRDSRLTFLLQDSLGGNSKTMIIANVSPSACSSNETLSTLKFAQRAKLIQNNAKVNEDASGDVTALQRQIQQLKYQLSSVLKIHNISRSPSQRVEESGPCNNYKKCTGEGTVDNNVDCGQNKKIKGMEAMVIGAMRREKMAETALKRLEAEIQLMNRLACHREEDAQRSKMILKFREEKIKQLELLVNGSISAEEYLMQENMALTEEIQLLKAKLDRNPESTRFALKNIRLLEQLRVFQNFYEQGEREILLTEVAELRDQLLDVIEEKDGSSKRYDNHGNDTVKELENCRTMNLKLIREVGKLQKELGKYMNLEQATFNSVTDSSSKNPEEYIHTEKHSWVETLSNRSDSGDDVSSFAQADSLTAQDTDQKMSNPNDPHKELMDAPLLIEALETEQIQLLKELEFMQKQNRRYMDILNNKRNIETRDMLKLGSYHQSSESGEAEKINKVLLKEASKDIDAYSNARLEELSKELEVARSLNSHYREYQASQLSRQHQVDMVCEQVEMETTETILHLQEEVTALQLELDERVCSMAQENTSLRKIISAKEDEIGLLSAEWERAILELTNFLIDGSRSLQDVSSLIESISCSLPQVSITINENVERATRVCIEKDETILLLQKSLEDAQKMVMEMEDKLMSLKGATIAFNECHQPNNVKITKEASQLSLLNEEIDIARVLESKLKYKEDQITIAEKRAEVAFIVLNWLSDFNMVVPRDGTDWNVPISKPAKIFDMKAQTNTAPTGDAENHTNLSALGMPESDNSVSTYCNDKGQTLSVLETSMFEQSSAHLRMIQELVKEIHEMRHNFISFKENSKDHQFFVNVNDYLECKDQSYILWQIKDELALTNGRLTAIEACISDKLCVHAFPTNDEDLTEADGWSADYCTSSSDYSTDTVASGNSYNVSSSTYCTKFGSETAEAVDLKLQGGSTLEETKKSEMELNISVLEDETTLSLRKELEMASDAFSKLYSRLTRILDENDFGGYVSSKGEKQEITYLGSTGDIDVVSRRPNKAIASKKVDHVSSFLNKFEEARATMKEADVMLNALLKTNEKATQLNVMWEQASEQLVTEKRNLSEEVEQLKSSIGVKEGENEALMDLIRHSMSEIVRSICLLEGCFVELKKEVEDKFNELYSDVLLIRREMQNFISNSRSSLEEASFEILADDFALYILYLCHIRKFLPTNSIPSLESGVRSLKQQQMKSNNCLQKFSSGCQYNLTTYNNAVKEQDSAELVSNVEEREPCSHNNLLYENLSLKRELERKEVLLQGLLFDFRLLQESASSNKDIKDETEQLFSNLNQVRHELEMKTSQLDDLLLQHKKLESSLTDSEISLSLSNSNLQLAQEMVDTLSDQNAELRVLLKDIYLKKSEADEELEEKREVVNGLEKEILHLASMEKELLSSVDSMEEDLRRVSKDREELREEIKSIEEDMKKMTSEREKLQKEVYFLNDKLEMAYALADEHEAVAIEARQESEASKTYANQKEEEVRILEYSVEELERTVNVLEKKVYEMDEEVERHRVIRDSLEIELQALRHRLLTVGNFSDIGGSDNNNENNEAQTTRELCDRLLQLHEAHARIKVLEREREEQNKEIKRYRDYISELELHSEAQASQYQLKYKTLETMIRETKTDLSNPTSTAPTLEKNEKAMMRTRGSSSPFRCIASLVQQMNSEKDQELSIARQHIEELEALAASRQKEVCVLNTRLAAAESMTHDVIRDLLGVKLDMTNYANLIEQHDVQKLVLEAHRQTEESLEKEQVILDLKKQISDLIEERESCMTNINKKDTDIMAAQITVEQLQEQHQLLQAQNELLKMEKNNLKRRITELDSMVKALLSTSSSQKQSIQTSNVKETGSRRKMGDSDFTRRLAHSEKILSRVNNELAQYRSSGGSGILDKTSVHGYGTRQREQ